MPIPVYTFQLVDAPHVASGGARGALTTARSRVVNLVKDDQSTCQWSMDYYRPGTRLLSQDVQLFTPRNTDVIVYRDTNVLFRGRITTHEIDADENGHVTVVMSALSYKGMLKRRFLLDADCRHTVLASGAQGPMQRNYAATADLGSIVWDLISLAQAPAYGTFGIGASSDGITGSPAAMTEQSGVTIPSQNTAGYVWTGGSGNLGGTAGAVVEFPVGISIYDAIEKIAAGNNNATTTFGTTTVNSTGFEWDILPDSNGNLSLHMWATTRAAPHSPGRGEQTGYVLDYGGAVQTSKTGYDTADFANFVRMSAGQSAYARTIGGGNAVDGLWEGVDQVPVPLPANLPSIVTTLPTLDKAAALTYFLRSQVRQSYTVTLRPGLWRWGDTALGDTVVVQVPNLEGVSADSQRVLTQSFTIGDNGDETVGLSLGAPPWSATARQRQLGEAYRKLMAHLFGGTG